MQITPQILSIPPYLSTTWKNIASLHALPEGDRFKLFVLLNNRMRIAIPDLSKIDIDSIFNAHALYGSTPSQQQPASQLPSIGGLSFPLSGGGNGVELLNTAIQHNPDQANSPEIPKEILDKLAGIAKVLGLDDASQLPKAEPHCNCPFCQISRALQGQPTAEVVVEEDLITEADLTFRNWDIKQSAESNKLYIVSNPFDKNEHYSVFLGQPLGCTCGEKNCEHIRAVLNT